MEAGGDIEEVKEEERENGSSVEQDVDVKSLAPEEVVKVKAHFSGKSLNPLASTWNMGMDG